MNTANHRFRLLAFSLQLSAFSLFLTGCKILPEPQADTVRHFTLSGPAAGTAVADAVKVRPVQLAGHLRNRSMAVRVSANEVIYLDDVRWAEPLDEAITQILRDRLGSAGGGSVAVRIQRCELVRSEGNSVQLAATYVITGPDGEVRARTFTASNRTWDGGDHGALVGLLRAAVEELAEAVAAETAAK